MPEYTIPLMLTVKADDMAQAFSIAEDVAEFVGQAGENIYAATPDAFDNDDQRVYYLPADANEPKGGWCSGCGEAGHTDEDPHDASYRRARADEAHLRAMREKPVHGPEERLAGQRLSMGRVPMLREPTEGHTSRQLTEACKRYGCHVCPTPGHQNEGRCNRCGREG